MTVDRIASDEPDQVGIIPQPIVFWYRGQRFDAAVSKSATTTERLVRESGTWVHDFKGDRGRAWLADPCSMALHEGLQASRLYEDSRAAADRQARRKAKAALLEEEAAARRTKTARW